MRFKTERRVVKHHHSTAYKNWKRP